MNKLTYQTVAVVALLSFAATAAVTTWAVSAQDRRIAYDDWYGGTKKTLADHYTGKTVRLRMAIPATRRGLEMTDGAVESQAAKDSAQTLAQAGDELTIENFKIHDTSIELLLNKTGQPRKSRFFSWSKQPRISLRFSHELSAKEMTIESINRWLATAVDISPLVPAIAEQPSNATQASITPVPEPRAKAVGRNNAQGLLMATVTGDLPNVSQNIGELTVTDSTGPIGQARVYIDNAYSGFAPRTVRLRAGVHSILVMANGYAAWEQRLVIPGGKASIVKADLRR
ncbi:MAG: PEGA domain-containing protein [Blastocatellia bacterium]